MEGGDKLGLFIKYYNVIKIKNRFNSENACYHSLQSSVFPPAVYEWWSIQTTILNL
jgi:hypothetical protein